MSDQPIAIRSATPFLIVRSLRAAVDHYRDKLGFASQWEIPQENPFFASVARDGVSVMLKEIGPQVAPLPNYQRHVWARWDLFIETEDPAGLYQELCDRGATIHVPLADTTDGLRAFEVRDVDDYVICFGRKLA